MTVKDHLTLEELGALFGGRAELVDLREQSVQITKEFLAAELQSLETQRINAHAVMNQAMGAIMFCQAMLARLDAPDAQHGDQSQEESK